MGKTAFLFNGQGTQYVGMGADFYEKNQAFQICLDDLNRSRIGFDLKTLCFHGPQEQLNQTRYTQSCVAAISLAIARAAMDMGLQPDVAGGMSLGEYSALALAGAFDAEQLLRLVQIRGLLMEDNLAGTESGMMAVIKPDLELTEQICQEIRKENPDQVLTIANYNSPKQIVLSGTMPALHMAGKRLKEMGMRTTFLKVSGAFHSSLLGNAAAEMQHVLEQEPCHPVRIPVVCNLDGRLRQKSLTDQLPVLMREQMTHGVQWIRMIETLQQEGVDLFVEIGPGRTLSKLIHQIDPDARVLSIAHVDDLDQIASFISDSSAEIRNLAEVMRMEKSKN